MIFLGRWFLDVHACVHRSLTILASDGSLRHCRTEAWGLWGALRGIVMNE
jgi:hypothetical protein